LFGGVRGKHPVSPREITDPWGVAPGYGVRRPLAFAEKRQFGDVNSVCPEAWLKAKLTVA